MRRCQAKRPEARHVSPFGDALKFFSGRHRRWYCGFVFPNPAGYPSLTQVEGDDCFKIRVAGDGLPSDLRHPTVAVDPPMNPLGTPKLTTRTASQPRMPASTLRICHPPLAFSPRRLLLRAGPRTSRPGFNLQARDRPARFGSAPRGGCCSPTRCHTTRQGGPALIDRWAAHELAGCRKQRCGSCRLCRC